MNQHVTRCALAQTLLNLSFILEPLELTLSYVYHMSTHAKVINMAKPGVASY